MVVLLLYSLCSWICGCSPQAFLSLEKWSAEGVLCFSENTVASLNLAWYFFSTWNEIMAEMKLQSSNWAALSCWAPRADCGCPFSHLSVLLWVQPGARGSPWAVFGFHTLRNVTSKPCLAEISSPNWPVNRSGTVPEDRKPKSFAF